MKPSIGQYCYRLRGRFYRIYRYVEVNRHSSSAEPVISEPSFSDPQEARRRVYQLNGWNYNK